MRNVQSNYPNLSPHSSLRFKLQLLRVKFISNPGDKFKFERCPRNISQRALLSKKLIWMFCLWFGYWCEDRRTPHYCYLASSIRTNRLWINPKMNCTFPGMFDDSIFQLGRQNTLHNIVQSSIIAIFSSL